MSDDLQFPKAFLPSTQNPSHRHHPKPNAETRITCCIADHRSSVHRATNICIMAAFNCRLKVYTWHGCECEQPLYYYRHCQLQWWFIWAQKNARIFFIFTIISNSINQHFIQTFFAAHCLCLRLIDLIVRRSMCTLAHVCVYFFFTSTHSHVTRCAFRVADSANAYIFIST